MTCAHMGCRRGGRVGCRCESSVRVTPKSASRHTVSPYTLLCAITAGMGTFQSTSLPLKQGELAVRIGG